MSHRDQVDLITSRIELINDPVITHPQLEFLPALQADVRILSQATAQFTDLGFHPQPDG